MPTLQQHMIRVHGAISNYAVRREVFENRNYMVVPVVMMVEGVHHGTAGPMFYPREELGHCPWAWNGRPVVIYHPEDDSGNNLSANSPNVLGEYQIGTIFNSEFQEDGAKLRAEAWIDVERAKEIAPMVLALISSGREVEVSTGMWFDADGVSGNWNGEEFESTVYNYRPDHLAFLPGQVGACSWEDGCGVRANEAQPEEAMPKMNTQPNADPAKPANGDDKGQAAVATAQAAQGSPEIKEPERQKNLITLLTALKSYGPAVTINADMSHNAVQRRLQNAINGMDSDRWVHYVRDVFADHFIYEARGHDPATGIYMCHLYMRDYTIDETGTIVTLGDTVTEVIEETTFIPVPAMAANHRKETPPMNKEKIDALIANEATNFVECDRAWLGTLKDDQLDKLVPKDPPKPDPAANAKPEPKPEPPKTAEEYVAAAPESYRPLLTNALETVKAEKKALVDALLANANNKFTQEQLDAKDVAELRNLVELGKVEVNFEGKGGGPVTQPVANGPGDVLDAPKHEVKQPATA